MLTRIRDQVSRNEQRHHDRRIVLGTLSVMAFVLAAKVFGAAKEILVAARYGTSAPVDAYLLLFRLYDLPVSIWAGTLGVTFVPLFFRLRDSPELFARFRAELVGVTILGGVLLALAAGVGVPWILRAAPLGLSLEVQSVAIEMARPLALMIPLGLLTGLVFARMVAAENRVVSLYEGAPAAVLFLILIFSPGGEIDPLVWGTVAGYAVALILMLAAQGRVEPLTRPVIRTQSRLWRDFTRFSLVVATSGFVIGVTVVIDQLMVAHLGTAAIATLGYAMRIVSLVTAIGATAITRVILPVLSDVEARGGDSGKRIASRWALVFMALGVLGILVGWPLAPILVEVMFERGAFTANDTAAVVDVLRWGLLQLPFAFAGPVFAQLWAARQRFMAFLYVNTFAVALKLITNFLLIDSLGINGVMVGTAVMYAACLAVLWYFAPRSAA
jgi:peptidoglycan biosynthesis protein MviN/MurJ (putative lipid II flippase)